MVAVNKTFYPARTWMPPHPATIKSAFRVAVCVCCYKEATFTIASAPHFLLEHRAYSTVIRTGCASAATRRQRTQSQVRPTFKLFLLLEHCAYSTVIRSEMYQKAGRQPVPQHLTPSDYSLIGCMLIAT